MSESDAPNPPLVHVLRVFARSDGVGGNPLGVVLEGQDVPDPVERQRIAAELGYSETVFVDDQATGELRIFTPTVELPLAGHPLVGTAWLLAREGHAVSELRPAPGAVSARADEHGAQVSAPPEWGPPFELVRFDSPGDIDALDGPPDGLGSVSCWAWIDAERGSVRARVFVPEYGVPEDEATGSAALRLCALLGVPIEIHQGEASLIRARPVEDGRVEIAGTVFEEGTRPLP